MINLLKNISILICLFILTACPPNRKEDMDEFYKDLKSNSSSSTGGSGSGSGGSGSHSCSNITNDYKAWATRVTDAVANDQINTQCNSYQAQMALYEISARVVESCGNVPGFSQSASTYRSYVATTKKINDQMGCGTSFYNQAISWW